MTEISRKMASVQLIAEVKPIEGAYLIEAYRVGGWWVVDTKGKYQVGDKVVYVETDAWVPTEIAPFLSKGKEPKEFNGVKGERLRSVKLRGQVSQGLLLPTCIALEEMVGNDDYDDGQEICEFLYIGQDLTKLLGVQKWEAPIPACLAGDVKGNFPSSVPKTDQPRLQNLTKEFEDLQKHTYEVTEKLHGSSCTMLLDTDGEFHVCSRNLDLKFSESNAYWKAAVKYNVEQKMKYNNLQGLAIQGELIGEGINGNQYKTALNFYVFDMYDTVKREYLDAREREALCELLGLKTVPVLETEFSIKDWTIAGLLSYAEGKSELNGSEREGLVFKSLQDPSVSFKIISNRWACRFE